MGRLSKRKTTRRVRSLTRNEKSRQPILMTKEHLAGMARLSKRTGRKKKEEEVKELVTEAHNLENEIEEVGDATPKIKEQKKDEAEVEDGTQKKEEEVKEL